MFCEDASRGGDIFREDKECDQNTDEWLAWRKKGIGSSDASVLAGINIYKTVHDLWLDKLGEVVKEPMPYPAQRGKDLEPVARDIFEYQFKVKIPPKNFIHPQYEFMKASLDGWNEEERYIVEIKTPMPTSKDLIWPDQVPEKYYPQLQWQLLVTDANHAEYVTFDGKHTIWTKRVYPNKNYQKNLVRLAKWFWKQVLEKKPIKENYKVKLKTPQY